jgi:L-lactate dehydrogenase complex protein LldG
LVAVAMSAERENFLARVRAALVDVPADEPADRPAEQPGYRVEAELSGEELIGRFAERAADFTASVRKAEAGAVGEAVAAALASRGARRLVVPAGLREAWLPPGCELHLDEPRLELAELDAVDGALTGCELAIAETGTVVLAGMPGQGRRALTLVPDLHVCVIEAEQIVWSVPEAIRALESTVRASGLPLTFLSGPSATSDIELERVEGVHGPRQLELVIVA